MFFLSFLQVVYSRQVFHAFIITVFCQKPAALASFDCSSRFCSINKSKQQQLHVLDWYGAQCMVLQLQADHVTVVWYMRRSVQKPCRVWVFRFSVCVLYAGNSYQVPKLHVQYSNVHLVIKLTYHFSPSVPRMCKFQVLDSQHSLLCQDLAAFHSSTKINPEQQETLPLVQKLRYHDF